MEVPDPTTVDYIEHTGVICCNSSVSISRAVRNVLHWVLPQSVYTFRPLGWVSRIQICQML